MKLNKVAFAVASALAIASGASQAGQINSSSTTLATEVIWSDAQVVRAPSNAYTFAGDIDARTNEQRLQLQYTLTKGEWGTGLVGATLTDVTASGVLKVAYKDAADVTQVTLPAGTKVEAFVTNSGKTLAFNVTIPAGAAAADFLLRNAVWTLNADATVGTNNTGITKLLGVAGTVACVAPDATVDINFKHFTNHTGAAVLQTNASPDSEHLRVGSTNDARFLNFTQNLKFTFSKVGYTASQVDASNLRKTFVGAVTTHKLGVIKLSRVATGLDLDYTNIYGKTLVTSSFNTAAGLVADGTVDLGTNGLTVTVTGKRATNATLAFYPVTGVDANGKPNAFGSALASAVVSGSPTEDTLSTR